MKKAYLSAAGILICICMCGGCGLRNGDFEDGDLGNGDYEDADYEDGDYENADLGIGEEIPSENPFEQEDGGLETTVRGTISHGVQWGEGEAYHLTYEGGEMQIPYFMQGSGIGKDCGFLLFLDGIPQPYKVEGQDTGYQYMHLFELEEEKDETYVIRFTPVTGKKGQELSICITSIINPEFMPDMKNSFSYGHSHMAMEAVYPFLFQEDAGHDEALSEKTEEKGREIIRNLVEEERETDRDFIRELEEERTGAVNLEKDVETMLSISGESMRLSETADISGKETLHVRYIIMGHPGAEYKTVFYLNHEPLTYKGEEAFVSVLKSGKMWVAEFDLDTKNLEGATFYAISVPCNSADYPDDVLMMYKSNSIFLHQADH